LDRGAFGERDYLQQTKTLLKFLNLVFHENCFAVITLMGKQYPQSIVKKTETTCVWESRQ
jgi:hypothetical protein